MVGRALKPAYRSGIIDVEQYTDICRAVSRMMYEKILSGGGLGRVGGRQRTRWESMAADEIDPYIKSILAERASAASLARGGRGVTVIAA